MLTRGISTVFCKTVEIFCDYPITGKLATFDEVKLINNQFFGKYDLFVAVDCGDIFRTGEFSGLYDSQKETLTMKKLPLIYSIVTLLRRFTDDKQWIT